MYYEHVTEERRLWKVILFSILTLGIYDLVFWWGLCRDLNRVCGLVEENDDSKSPNFIVFVLFGIITFGIYPFYWYYKQGNRMSRAAREYGFEIDERGGTYLLWMLVGALLLGIGLWIAFYLFIRNVNKLARAYNYRVQEMQSGNYVPDAVEYDPPHVDNFPSQTPSSGVRVAPPIPPQITPAGGIPNSTAGGVQVKDDNPTFAMKIGTLEGVGGSCSGMKIPVYPGKSLIVGRDPSLCQIILQERDISRRHCKIEFLETGLFSVTDYSTYNTTYLNGTIRLEQGVPRNCPVGSRLTLGKGTIQFLLQ